MGKADVMEWRSFFAQCALAAEVDAEGSEDAVGETDGGGGDDRGHGWGHGAEGGGVVVEQESRITPPLQVVQIHGGVQLHYVIYLNKH